MHQTDLLYTVNRWILDEFVLLLSNLHKTVWVKTRQNKHPGAGIADGQSVCWGNERFGIIRIE